MEESGERGRARELAGKEENEKQEELASRRKGKWGEGMRQAGRGESGRVGG